MKCPTCSQRMNAWPIGTALRLTAKGAKAFPKKQGQPAVVSGYTRDDRLIRIIVGQNRCPENYWAGFWEPVAP